MSTPAPIHRALPVRPIAPVMAPRIAVPATLTPNVEVPSAVYGVASTVPYVGFVADTMITCKVNGTEQAVAVQNLKPGTLVKTTSGMFRPVEKIGSRSLTNPATSNRLANRLYTLSKADYPALSEDLIMTGNRSVLVPTTTDAQKRQMIAVHGCICVTDKLFSLPCAADANATPFTVAGEVIVYNFSIVSSRKTTNYGVYANGLLVDCSSSVQLMNKVYTLLQ